MHYKVGFLVAQTTSRKQQAQVMSSAPKKFGCHRQIKGEYTIIIVTIREGPGPTDEFVSIMMAGEEQGLEDGGQGGGGEIIEAWKPRVCLVFNLHDVLLYVKSKTSCGPSTIPVPFTTLMFFPPLDSTVVIDVPPNARSGGVSLLFRARTGSASALEQLKRDGVKVQAWTNAPVDNGRAEGTWGAYNFEEAPAATLVKLDDSVVPFSLPPPTEDNFVDEPYTLFLTLRLRALPQQQTEADFLVTYRFLYPNGGVKWLGYQGRDLRCVLKKTDPWLAPPATVDQSSGNVYRIFSSITMKESWGCWAIGARRSVITVYCGDAHELMWTSSI